MVIEQGNIIKHAVNSCGKPGMNKMLRILGLILLIIMPVFSAHAETSLVLVDQEGDWVVYRSEGTLTECGIMSMTTDEVYTRNGRRVKANRGPTRVIISYLKGNFDQPLLAFQAGFPIKSNSTVSIVIDGSKFNLYLDPSGKNNEWAWPTEADDKLITDTMRRGNEAVITSISQRGTKVVDTYSLKGVTRGLDRAKESCN